MMTIDGQLPKSGVSEVGGCMVLATNNVNAEGKGTPSAVTYNIQITPLNGQPFTVNGVKPNQRRPPDIVQLIAAKPGDTGLAQRVGSNWYFNVWEWADMAVCTSP